MTRIEIMKAITVTLILSFTSIYAESTHEHSKKEHKQESHGHSHHVNPFKNEVSKENIEKAAMQEVQSLVVEKKIHKSWKHVPISKIGKTHYGDTDDWVVGFENVKIKNKERRTLYIFVSVSGEIRGTNYTGN